MSNVKIQGNVSGTGNLILAAPNTNSDITLNLPTVMGTNNGSSIVTTDAAGNLGIGVAPSAWDTTNTTRAFQISNGPSIHGFNIGGASPYVWIGNNDYRSSGGTSRYVVSAAASSYFMNAGAHYWQTAPSGTAGAAISFVQAMTLDASGRLSVKTTTGGTACLTLRDGSGTDNCGIYFQGNSTNGNVFAIGTNISTNGNGANFDFYDLIAGVNRARIDSSGNLLVGTINNPSGFRLNVSGTVTASGSVSFPQSNNDTTANAANMNIQADGYLRRSTSALKYKQDIRDLESMDIGLLRPVRYKSKCVGDDQTKDHLGLIADEAADAGFEELVTRGAENEVEGFQYERLTVVLLKAIQELKAIIDTQAARITALEGTQP